MWKSSMQGKLDTSFTIVVLFAVFTATSHQLPCNEPSLMVSMPADIRCFQMTSQGQLGKEEVIVRFPLSYKGTYKWNVRALEVDVAERKIYYEDYLLHAFFEVSIDNPLIATKILDGIQNQVLLSALDWQAKFIYWADYHGSISVLSIKGKYQKTIVSNELKRPTGVAVDPVNGFLFWSDSILKKIEGSKLDGSSRFLLTYSSVIYPYDISLDSAAKRLYFIDQVGNSVCGINYNGQASRCFKKAAGLFFITGLAYHKSTNLQFLTVYGKNTIWSFNETSLETLNLYTPPVGASSAFRSQLRIFDKVMQPNSSNPCLLNNTGCSHFCFNMDSTSYKCSCPIGMNLNADGKSCGKKKVKYNILLTDSHLGSIYNFIRYEKETNLKMDLVYSSHNVFPTAVDYDLVNRRIYFSDISAGKIHSIDISGSGLKEIRSNAYCDGLRYDRVSNLIFWTDYKVKQLSVSKPDGSGLITLVSSNLDKPRDVELYQEMGLLFITDYGVKAKVEQMNMDGTNRKIVTGNTKYTEVIWPNGLALDRIEAVLYYVDAKLDKLRAYNIRTSVTREILTGSSKNTLHHAFGLSIYENDLYWTDWVNNTISKVNRRYGNDFSVIQWGLLHPQYLQIFKTQNTIEYRKCYVFDYGKEKCKNTCDKKALSEISQQKCPKGYKLSRTYIGCGQCIDGNHSMPGRRCPCEERAGSPVNWALCVHRIEQESTCTTQKQYLHFAVQECIQTLKPGYCRNSTKPTCSSNSTHCVADQDCPGKQKCCSSSCGLICQLPAEDPPSVHPCKGKYSKCSICVSMPNGKHRCLCDAGKAIDTDGITCSPLGANCQKSDFCHNDGECKITYVGPKCFCKSGYLGLQCESKLKCSAQSSCSGSVNGTAISVCQGNGVTIVKKCPCSQSIARWNCTDHQTCPKQWCKDNEICYLSQNGSRMCSCAPGYDRKDCSIWNACQPLPCKNGGRCLPSNDKPYKCACTGFFTGALCDVYDCNRHNPCNNSGICLPSGRERCKCKESFSGEYCQNLVCVPHLCQNNGKCKTLLAKECTCPRYYLGRFCTLSIADKTTKVKVAGNKGTLVSPHEFSEALSKSLTYYFNTGFCLTLNSRQRRDLNINKTLFLPDDIIVLPGTDSLSGGIHQEVEFIVTAPTTLPKHTPVTEKTILEPSLITKILTCTLAKLEMDMLAEVQLSAQKAPEEDDSLSLVDLIGPIVSGLALLIIISIAVCLWKKKRTKTKTKDKKETNDMHNRAFSMSMENFRHAQGMIPPPPYQSDYCTPVYEDIEKIKVDVLAQKFASNYYDTNPRVVLPTLPTSDYQDLHQVTQDSSTYQSLDMSSKRVTSTAYEVS